MFWWPSDTCLSQKKSPRRTRSLNPGYRRIPATNRSRRRRNRKKKLNYPRLNADKTNEKSNPRPPATIATKTPSGIKSESPEIDETSANKPEPKQIDAGKPVTSTPRKLPPLKPKDKGQSKTPAKTAASPDGSGRPRQPQAFEDPPLDEPQIDIAGGMKQLYDQKIDKQASEEKQQDVSLALKDTNMTVFAEKRNGKPFRAKRSAGPASVDADRDSLDRSITVSSDQYFTLFKNWRKVGESRKENGKILLRVENLRKAFSLFQMKAVAVVGNRRFFDLSDGSRLPEASLDDFSTTVFRVQQPWQKWGDALTAAGIRQSETIEIRYYMYDFIKNAIYERAEQAFAFCRQKGLIDMDTPHRVLISSAGPLLSKSRAADSSPCSYPSAWIPNPGRR